MLTVQIQIVPTGRSPQKASAWFLPGASVDQWANEIAKWPVEHNELSLMLVPISRSDRTAIGLLAFGASLSEANVERSAHAIPFRNLGKRFYIPADAMLEPELSSDEIACLVLEENTYVWHPSIGLVVVGPSEMLGVCDLMGMPASQWQQDWNFADAGVKFVDRLRSIEGPPVGSVDDIMGESRGNIGDKALDLELWKQQLGDTPEDPDKPRPISSVTFGLAKLASWFVGNSRGGAARRTWLNDLGDWASDKLSQASRELQERRHKELFRLQRLLESDPDQGLKYALPLAGGMEYRGQGAASGSLSQRNINFRLGGLGGGGAADHWDVPNEIRNKLLNQYRDLAQREIRLGRYRRAAYIYAELLSDLNAAAKALEAGKHFREAAVVYRSKLNRNQEAVRCLEEGRFWQEAIELHRELEQFESAADLFRKLNFDDEAESEYWIAIQKLLAKNDYLNAARIEETKLRRPQEALNTLELAWPKSAQGLACLEQSFRILADLGEHQRTRAWFQRVSQQTNTLPSLPQTVRLIAGLATTYPDRTTQHAAAEVTRQIVSREIGNGRLAPTDGLLNCVAKLAPDDRLLSRDCRRFLAGISSQEKMPATTRGQSVEIQRLRMIVLPEYSRWFQVVNARDSFVLIGQKGDELWVMRIPWSVEKIEGLDLINRLIYSLSSTWHSPRIISEFAGDRIGLVLHAIGEETFSVKTFHATDTAQSELNAGAVASLAEDSVGVTLFGYDQLATVRIVNNEQVVLETVNARGQLVGSQVVGHPRALNAATLPIPMASNGNHLYLIYGRKLQVYGQGGWIETLDLKEAARHIVTSARGTAARSAIAFDRGVQVLWGGVNSALTSKFCVEMERPHVVFTRSGHLVVASNELCEIYSTTQRRISYVGSFVIDSCEGLVTTNSSQRFAILSSDGKLHEYRIPLK